jgi:hypothetical protein
MKLKKINKKKVVKKGSVVHCRTRKESAKIRHWAYDQGLKYENKNSYLYEDGWHLHKENTCYDLYNGKCDNLSWYRDNGFDIVEYEDIFHNNNLLTKTKNWLKDFFNVYTNRKEKT